MGAQTNMLSDSLEIRVARRYAVLLTGSESSRPQRHINRHRRVDGDDLAIETEPQPGPLDTFDAVVPVVTDELVGWRVNGCRTAATRMDGVIGDAALCRRAVIRGLGSVASGQLDWTSPDVPHVGLRPTYRRNGRIL